MKIKKGVASNSVAPQIWYALGRIETIFGHKGLTITSMRDGKHKPTSLHYKGLAVDIRTRHLKYDDTINTVFELIHKMLTPLGFDVVLEKTHLHIEYDPRDGEEWITYVD